MITRNAFNGGEISPNASLRCDLDVYHRGASLISNFDVGQAGGLTRRRGIRTFNQAMANSRIFGYVSSTNVAYLVEVNNESVRLFNKYGQITDGNNVQTSFTSPWNDSDVQTLSSRQVNSLLIFTCLGKAPYVLKLTDGVWTFEKYDIKSHPERDSGIRDTKVRMRKNDPNVGIEFEATETDCEASIGDLLRVSVPIPEISLGNDAVITGGKEVKSVGSSSVFYMNDLLYSPDGQYLSRWIAKKAFNGANDFVAGFTKLEDYPEFFERGYPLGEVPCGGKWRFNCSGTWQGEYVVCRRYSKNEEATVIGTSFSPIGAEQNVVLTGDESEEECYISLRLTKTGSSQPIKNKLIVSSYKRKVWLELQSYATSPPVKKMTIAKTPIMHESFMFQINTAQYFNMVEIGETATVTEVYKDGVKLEGVSGSLTRDSSVINFTPIGLSIDQLGTPDETGVYTGEWKLVFHTPYKGTLRGSRRTYIPWIITVYNSQSGSQYGFKITAMHQVTGDVSVIANYPNGAGQNSLQIGGGQDYSDLVMSVEFNSTTPYYAIANATGNMHITGFSDVISGAGSTMSFKDVSKIQDRLPTSVSTYEWSWQAWRGVYGYPAKCDVLSQRLVFASSKAQPQTIWMSKTDDLNHFGISDADDGALAITLATTMQSDICWIMSQNNKLLAGTESGEWVIDGSKGVVTPTDVRAGSHGFIGSAKDLALVATDKCLYVERGGGRLWQYGYNYESDGYLSRDVTVFADHILSHGGGATRIAIQRKPHTRLLVVLANGDLALMTYNDQHEVHAWHRYEMANHSFIDVVALPNGNNEDTLFFLTVDKDGYRAIMIMEENEIYMDDMTIPYESVFISNGLDVVESLGEKRQSAKMMMYLGCAVGAGFIEVTNDGTTWTGLDRVGILKEGWHDLVTVSKIDREARVGVKTNANEPLIIRAIKG